MDRSFPIISIVSQHSLTLHMRFSAAHEFIYFKLAKDDDVLRSMHEKAQNGVAFRIEKLKKQYQDG